MVWRYCMEYITTIQASKKWQMSDRRIQQLCREGKIEGAVFENDLWLIPESTKSPKKRNRGTVIADTANIKKPLPIGVSEFKRAVSAYYYVDKTLLIKDLLDTKPQVSLFTRPRRFGKTLNMDMLRVFFEKTDEDTSVYFQDKKIWAYGEEYQKHQGQYPVIVVSFKDVKYDTWGETLSKIKDIIRHEFDRHSELETSEKLSAYNKEKYMEILLGKADDVAFSSSLGVLTELLYKHHGKKPILIIDEYDVPVQQGYNRKFYGDVILFLRNLFSNALKDNHNIEYAFMTGILRVAKESIFSGMNNLKIDSILDERYSQYFGFTKVEVTELLAYYNVKGKVREVCDWYDGYRFGKTEIFNPWSVLNYVDNRCEAKAYWQATGSNDIIGEIISQATPEIMDDLGKLMQGQEIMTYIDTNVIYPEIEKNPFSIYSFLLVAGYLKLVSKKEQNDSTYCRVAIPNKEISFVYEKEILAKLDGIVSQSSAIAIQEAISENDAERLKVEIQDYLLQTISYNDTASESFYHGLIVGFCAVMNNRYYVSSNKETGEGRYDITLEPHSKVLPGIIIELKSSKKSSEIKGLAEEALEQIDNMQYDVEMKRRGVKKIIKFGVAFCGKAIEIATQECIY